jgi:hypothetical protein
MSRAIGKRIKDICVVMESKPASSEDIRLGAAGMTSVSIAFIINNIVP